MKNRLNKSVKFSKYSTKLIWLFFGTLSIGVWSFVGLESKRILDSQEKIAEQKTAFQAQAFSENTVSIIKRLNDYLLFIREEVVDENNSIEKGLLNIDEKIRKNSPFGYGDVTFQTAVVDKKGLVLYSSIDKNVKDKKIDLSSREHIRVQLDNLNKDDLFISKPVFGKVSQKWSIQFTRKVFNKKNEVIGVLVASLSPDQLTSKNSMDDSTVTSVFLEDGTFLSRWPNFQIAMGEKLKDLSFLSSQKNIGNYKKSSIVGEKTEKIFGFYRVPEYKLVFTVSVKEEDMISQAWPMQLHIIIGGLLVNIFFLILTLILHKSVKERNGTYLLLNKQFLMFSSAMEKINDGLAIYDEDDKLIFFNNQFVEMFPDIKDLIVIGQKFEVLLMAAKDKGYYSYMDNSDEAIKTRLEQHKKGTTNELYCWNNKWIRLEETKTTDGYIVSKRTEVTDLVQSKEEAISANIAKSKFLATMSHELRTPMNGILGMVHLLEDGAVDKQEELEYLQTIKSCGKDLLALLNDILDLSKIESGKMIIEKIEFNAESLLTEVIFLYNSLAQSKKINLTFEWFGPKNISYISDSNRLRQVLSNLITNAIKFTPEGGYVSLYGKEKTIGNKNFIVISVEDSGIGIPSDKLNLLFKPFSQVDSSTTRFYGGTGLGLSIVKNIVELLGGKVYVESEIGKGSKFTIEIEVVRELDDDIQLEKKEEKLSIINNQNIKEDYILIVEDVRVNRMVLEGILKKQGLNYISVQNGKEACDYLSENNWPIIVLMDMQMPIMSGIDATIKIREMELIKNRKRTPIIAITANAFEENREECIRVGMDEFVSKPLNVEELVGKINKFI